MRNLVLVWEVAGGASTCELCANPWLICKDMFLLQTCLQFSCCSIATRRTLFAFGSSPCGMMGLHPENHPTPSYMKIEPQKSLFGEMSSFPR